MFNVLLYSDKNRTGKSTCARTLSKLLQMPHTSSGDLLRLYALENKNGFDRGFLVNDFLKEYDLQKLFNKYGNLSSEDFVKFHSNQVTKDISYDLDLDRYIFDRLLQGGWVIDSILGGILVKEVCKKDCKVYDEIVRYGRLSEEDANTLCKNTVTVYLTADINERAKRSAFYEETYGFETNEVEEKSKLSSRENINRKRYKKLYEVDIADGAKYADISIDTTDLTPVDVCMKIIEQSKPIQERLEELEIEDYKAEVEKIVSTINLKK